MKKILVLLLAVYLSSVTVQAEVTKNVTKCPAPAKAAVQQNIQRQNAFDQRLNLTAEQKQKSKEIRLDGRKKLKPVLEKIKALDEQMKQVKESNLTQEEQEKKLTKMKSDMKALRKKAHNIRVDNMKKFEKILTEEQLKTLQEMKQEGKKNIQKPCPPAKH